MIRAVKYTSIAVSAFTAGLMLAIGLTAPTANTYEVTAPVAEELLPVEAPVETIQITSDNIADFPQLNCLAQNIFFEAGIEGKAGKVAVALTTLNRVDDSRYPDTVCDVVKQGKKDKRGNMIRHKCQFSWYCDGKSDRVPPSANWEESIDVAYQVYIEGRYVGLVEGATHYHTDYVSPSWRHSLTRVSKVGRHIFYRWD